MYRRQQSIPYVKQSRLGFTFVSKNLNSILVLVSIVGILSSDKMFFRGMCLLFTDLRRAQKVCHEMLFHEISCCPTKVPHPTTPELVYSREAQLL